MKLFDNINIPEDKLHSKYKILRDAPFGDGEKRIIQKWTDDLKDRDNKMVKEFQTTFHSCLWEFYLFACFQELGFELNQSHNRPDFVIKSPDKINIEAVVANIKTNGRQESTRNINDLMDMFVPPRNQPDFFKVLDEAIVRDSNAIISKHKKYQNEYKKCDWVDEKTPFVIALSSYSQVNYGREYIYPMMALLYSKYYNPKTDSYEKKDYIIKPDTKAQIQIGLFTNEEFQNVSAIIYSCTTTLGKLTSLAISEGYLSDNSVYNLRRDYEDKKIPYKLQKVSCESPELLSDGLFIFHNPFAKNPLKVSIFENCNATQFFIEDGCIVHTSNTYPIVCRLNISKVLEQPFQNLIYEYYYQYINCSHIEAYSLLPYKKININYNYDCLVCVWVIIEENNSLKNIHYKRPKNIPNEYLKHDAFNEIKKFPSIKKIERIDIIRSQEQFDFYNQTI